MNRDQRLMSAFSAVAALALGVAGAGTVLDDSLVDVVARDVHAGPDGRLTVQFLGDTMLGDRLQLLVDQRGQGYDWPFDAVRPALDADFTIVNAEGTISEHTTPWNPAKKFSYISRPAAAGAFARAGIDAVTLANNHAYDAGPVGLAETMRHLDEVGILSVGAGSDIARAEQPLLIRSEAGTIGVIAIGESYGHRVAGDRGGTLVLSPETVARGAAIARTAGADWVVAAVHWGDNYAPIGPAQRAFAQVFADAGYDLVVGTGPHHVQPIEFIGSMPVIYSIGNFVFGTRGRWAEYNVRGFGLAVDLELGRDGPPRLSVRCLVIDNMAVAFQPRLCSPAEARGFLPTLSPRLTMEGDVGVLRCDGCFARPKDD
jgi:hypothetical protein